MTFKQHLRQYAEKELELTVTPTIDDSVGEYRRTFFLS